jgi:4a-hydroxytetrahydrobiopterin dehydratase
MQYWLNKWTVLIIYIYNLSKDHPDWSNVYNSVKVDLNTHDVGGLSIKDFLFAFAMV